MKRLSRAFLLSALVIAVILIHSSEGNQNKQFSHRRIQSGPPKYRRPPPPPHHRQRRPRPGGDRERPPPPPSHQHSGGNRHQRPQGPPPHHHGPPPSGPPKSSFNGGNGGNSHRPGPPYGGRESQSQSNKPQPPPLHPFTQQSPNAPAPSSLNPPPSSIVHPQQPQPMTSPPISEYAPPLNTFKPQPQHQQYKEPQGSGSMNQPIISQVPSGNGTMKHTITFTVTKRPSGATAINFQINAPGSSGSGLGPSTYKPPLDPSYPQAQYSMKDSTTPEDSSNDLLNPPPVFYNPQKDVIMNKDHPLNQVKLVNEIPDQDGKFSQPDPLFHEESKKDVEEEEVNSSTHILVAGHKPIPKKNFSKEKTQDATTQQLLAALGLSKNPLISAKESPKGEPLGLKDYLGLNSEPLFNKPDKIVDDERRKDQESALSESFPNLYEDFQSYQRPSSDSSGSGSQESKISSYLQERLRQNSRPSSSSSEFGSRPSSLYDRTPEKKAEPVSYIEQRLKGGDGSGNGNSKNNDNPYGPNPTNNFGSNFGLIDKDPQSSNNKPASSYLEEKLRQSINEQSYIQQLIQKEKEKEAQRGVYQDQSSAFSHPFQHQQPQPPTMKPALDLSHFAQHHQSRFGPSTLSPSSIEMEEFDKSQVGQGLYGNSGASHHPFNEQLSSASGKIGLLPGNILLPGGFGGSNIQQQQPQAQVPYGQNPVYNRAPYPTQNSPQHPHSYVPHGSGEQAAQPQVPYPPHPGQQHQYTQETQAFHQRLHPDQQQQQHQHNQFQPPQYQAINPAAQAQHPQQYQHQQQQQQTFQHQNQQASIQNYNYQVPQQDPQQAGGHHHPNALPPPGDFGHGHHGGPGDGPGGPGGPPPTPHPPQVFVVTEAEPIIEIIVQDSNVTLPAQQIPAPPPPPPPTPEPVHVFYVKYSENKVGGPDGPFNPHDPEINLESPVPSINVRGPQPHHPHYGPPEDVGGYPDSYPQFSEIHQQHQHQHHRTLNVTSGEDSQSQPATQPPSSTTLRTLIDPSQNTFSDTKLAVHFDQPPEQYPFDIQKYQQQQKQLEAQAHQEHLSQQQQHQHQQHQHQQLIHQIQQDTNHQFLSKRIGLEDFTSLLREESGPQSQSHQSQRSEAEHHNLQNHKFHSNQQQQQDAGDKSKELPPDVPAHLKQQLIQSGILANAEVQVVNFDENLFKELSSLPPEALSALQKQTQFPTQGASSYPQEDLASLQKRHVRKVFIQRKIRKQPRSILFQTEDNHLYRLKNLAKSKRVEKLC